MDGQAFDTLVRATSEAASRRGTIGLLLGGVVTAALARFESALGRKKGKGKGKNKNKKKKCRKLNQGCGGKKKKCCKGLTCTDGNCLTPSACIDDAVQAAIDAAAPGATLTLCAGTFSEIIVIEKNLTLIGTGDGAGTGNTILDGAGDGPVVTIEAGSTVTLQNLRLTGGDTASGGGISNSGTLALTGCTVIGNTADGGFGGGIFNDGTLTLTDCAVIGNTADNGGGGGGIRNRGGTMELINSSVSGNTAADGGGILNFGTLELIDSSVTANAAGSSGGGIDNSGTVICSGSSTVRDNTEGDPPVRSNCVDSDGTGCATCPG